jgi:hypothetical protein
MTKLEGEPDACPARWSRACPTIAWHGHPLVPDASGSAEKIAKRTQLPARDFDRTEALGIQIAHRSGRRRARFAPCRAAWSEALYV